MENKKFDLKKFSLRQIPEFAKLYVTQVAIVLTAWVLNKLCFKESVSEIIQDASKDFAPIVVYTEPWYQILIKSFVVISIIYVLIFVISMLTHSVVGKVLYLLLALTVAFAAGNSFGGGLFTYSWGLKWIVTLLGQVEWLGGALIVSSFQKSKKLKMTELIVGGVLLFLSSLCAVFLI